MAKTFAQVTLQLIFIIALGLAAYAGKAWIDAALKERIRRIAQLIDGNCKPADQGDVWLEGCAQ